MQPYIHSLIPRLLSDAYEVEESLAIEEVFWPEGIEIGKFFNLTNA